MSAPQIVATLSPEPAHTPFLPIRSTIPVPPEFTNSGDALCIRNANGDRYPTQQRKHGRRAVELVAVVDRWSIDGGLSVERLELDALPAVVKQPAWHPVASATDPAFAPLCLLYTPVGPYSARLVLRANHDRTGRVRTAYTFDAVLRPTADGIDAPPHLGRLRGHVDTFNGLPYAEWSMRWDTSDVQDGTAVSEVLFDSIEMQLPGGVAAAAVSLGGWIGETRTVPDTGEDRFQLIAQDPAGDLNAMRGNRNKPLRFHWIADWAAGWSDEMRYDPGYRTAWPTDDGPGWCASNPETPIQLDGGIVPDQLPEHLRSALLADADEFIKQRIDGTPHAGSPVGRLGAFHPLGTPWGGETGGEGVWHDGPVQTLAYHAPTIARIWAWERAEGYLDRTSGFISVDGEPVRADALPTDRMLHPDRKLTWNVTPAPTGNANSVLVPRRTEDPFGVLDGAKIGIDGSGGDDEFWQQRFGSIDDMHRIRGLADLQVLVECFADPLAEDILADMAMAGVLDLWGLPPAHGPHRGTQLHRGHGWTGRMAAVALAYRRGTREAETCAFWLDRLATLMGEGRMNNGGLIAWQFQGQKEVAQVWEAAGRELAITQSYQECILLDCERHMVGLGLLGQVNLDMHLFAICVVGRKPGERAPRYRYGVYALPDGEPGYDYAHTEELYAEPSQSEYHYTYALAVAQSLMPDLAADHREAFEKVLADYAQGATTEKLLDQLTSSVAHYTNAEELVARLMLPDSDPDNA